MSDVTDRRRHSQLRLKRLGIDTYREHVIYMSRVCRSEGFEVRSRVAVSLAGKSILATLNVVDGGLLSSEEAGLSKAAWERLGASEGETVAVSHAPPLASDSFLRKKVYGGELAKQELAAVVAEIAAEATTTSSLRHSSPHAPGTGSISGRLPTSRPRSGAWAIPVR